MTAANGYVWFLPVYVSLKLNETSVLYNNDSCTASEMRKVLDNHFAMAHVNFGEDHDILPTGQNISEWKKSYKYVRKINFISPADYAPFVYDTIWVYVKALWELSKVDNNSYYLKNLQRDDTQTKLSEIIENINFTGVTGQIQFNKAGSRYTDINIFQWQNNNFTLVGTYHPLVLNRESNNGTLQWNGEVKWLNGKVPDDGRESCIFDFLGIECQLINSIIIAFFCISTILACSCFSFLFWKHKYAKKLEESAQIMTNYGLVVNGIELSRWELARENVILNRRIGEGAFGTVYGGEALIKDTEGWIPVAIKTLKPHALPEARLDFLAESEVMKRFDHKNIVKLLAVCLQKEPLFMLSEFMLYGDLKTFLLARRHLVDDKIHDDSNDISPKRLTLMALDIARGLSYLGSLNFIHRDIACRNCLINAQRICKIG
jgi:Protein tyrosine and serine/threonine kinase/Receptor family ligand binding region